MKESIHICGMYLFRGMGTDGADVQDTSIQPSTLVASHRANAHIYDPASQRKFPRLKTKPCFSSFMCGRHMKLPTKHGRSVMSHSHFINYPSREETLRNKYLASSHPSYAEDVFIRLFFPE